MNRNEYRIASQNARVTLRRGQGAAVCAKPYLFLFRQSDGTVAASPLVKGDNPNQAFDYLLRTNDIGMRRVMLASARSFFPGRVRLP